MILRYIKENTWRMLCHLWFCA